MKIDKHYTFFTDSYKVFLEYFIKTYKWEDSVDLVIQRVDQNDEDVITQPDTHFKIGKHKFNLILDILKKTQIGDIFIFSDIDMVFCQSYKNKILKNIKNKDLIFSISLQKQSNGTILPQYSSSFIAIKTSSKTKKFFQDVISNMHDFENCDAAINNLLSDNRHGLSVGNFHKDISNINFLNIDPNTIDNIVTPNDIIAFHANSIKGVDNKLNLLKSVLKNIID